MIPKMIPAMIPAMTPTTRLLSLLLTVAAVGGAATPTRAQNQVVSIGKDYAYFLTVPGQPPNHYRDDGATSGTHPVHTQGLGVYGLGNLTDGVNSTTAGAGPGTPHLAMWAQCCGNAPAADIIIDLGMIHVVTDMTLGTVVAQASNNNAPDDVTVSFSLAGTNYTSAQLYDLETAYGPLADGHHDMQLKLGAPVPARYVKFSFDGGSMREPNGSDPDEKWMLDELTVRANTNSCIAAANNYGKGLAGLNGVPTLTVSAPPRFSSRIDLQVGNSSGATAPGLVLVGLQGAAVPILGGVLLVQPLVQTGVSIPGAGFSRTFTVPGPPCVVPICLQVLQLDAAASAGVSMSRGLRLDLGN